MSSTTSPEEMSEHLQATGTDGPVNLRETVAERLAAHRSRRAHLSAQMRAAEAEQEAVARQRHESARSEQRRGASTVRDAVRARYEGSPSYREFLAAEAERALAQAQAEVEVAARTARAVADAQMQLLEEMEQWKAQEGSPREQAMAAHQAELRGDLAHALADIVLGARELLAEPPHLAIVEAMPQGAPADTSTAQAPSPALSPGVTEVSAGGLTVKLYEDLGPMRRGAGSHAQPSAPSPGRSHEFTDELQALEHEIEFRRAPEFQDHVIKTTPIPGNLIEFPRELIAPRKARPRLAEGPLRDGIGGPEPQLRIFEVEAEQEEPVPARSDVASAAEWQSLQLEAHREPQISTPHTAQAHFTSDPQTAPLELRLMAAVVDLCLIGAAFLAFATMAAVVAGTGLRELPLSLTLISGLGCFATLGFLYQMLFFTFNNWTPGMLYARIGLCTFGDRNPTRKAMRRRVLATLLAACPLGLGLLWMWMDDDRLGWHDRMSRMYQRAY